MQPRARPQLILTTQWVEIGSTHAHNAVRSRVQVLVRNRDFRLCAPQEPSSRVVACVYLAVAAVSFAKVAAEH